MTATQQKTTRRSRRKIGIRKRLFGTAEKPRLTVFRSGKHLYAQVVDDLNGKTLAAAGSVALKLEKGYNVDAASKVGADIAQKARQAGVTEVAFDRNGYRYHGRVKALADAAREGGLKF